MEKAPTISEKINKIYDITFFDRYIVSILSMIAIFGIFGYLHARLYFFSNIHKYKETWPTSRCDPDKQLFAGYVYPNVDGTYNSEYASQNFAHCSEKTLENVVETATGPINETIGENFKVFTVFSEVLDNIRKQIASLKDGVNNLVGNLFNQVAATLINVQKMILPIKDVFNKFLGMLVTCLHVTTGSVMSLNTLLGAMMEFLLMVVTVTFAAAIVFALGIFTWPISVGLIIFGVLVLTLVIIVGKAMPELFELYKLRIPRKPRLKKPFCFGEDTQVRLFIGKYKNIASVKIGDMLRDKSVITSVFKVNPMDEHLYNIKNTNIFVTALHKVYHINKWIDARDHPGAVCINKHIDKKKVKLFCFNTSSKIIELEGYKFLDYDEMNTKELKKLKVGVNNLHHEYDGGLNRNTMIPMNNGTQKPIYKIVPGDILKGNNMVDCVCLIDGIDIKGHFKYFVNGECFLGSHNLWIYNKSLGKIVHSTNCSRTPLYKSKESLLYHLVCLKDSFYVNKETKIKDYNSLIDDHLK